MKAVILAAGEGSRLRPFTETRPKVMFPVANRPILEYKVRTLARLGFEEVVLVVGYRREKVQSYFGDGDEWGVDIEYVVQEDQLGTARAVERVRGLVGDRFLVMNGDNIVHPGAVEGFVESIDEGNGVLLKRTEVGGDYGAVSVEDGEVVEIDEKSVEEGKRLVNLGIYIFTDEVFDGIDETEQSVRGEYEITSSLQRMIDSGISVGAVETDLTWMDAVYPWDLVEVNAAVLEGGEEFYAEPGVEGRVEDGAVVRGPVSVGRGSVVRSGAYVAGPCVIGENCDVGPGAVLLPATSLGDNVSVEPGAVVENSVVMSGSRLGASSSLKNSVVGEGCRLGSHLVSDSGEARVEVKDRLHLVEDIGGMVADDSDIGASVTISPGKVVGRGCEVRPGTVVRENVESGSRLTG